jgi:threonine/homoserine/homoserine lactone efflux protein
MRSRADLVDLLPFAGTAALIVMSPGPDLPLVLRSVLAGGRRAALLTGFGIATGSGIWALGVILGLAAVFSASPGILTVIRWFGAAYLAWLGLRTLVLSDRAVPEPPMASRPRAVGTPFRMGLVGNLLHPGQVVFYTSMLPQFIDPTANPTRQGLILGTIFVAIVLAWFSTVAFLASAIRRRRWGRIGTSVTRIAAILLIAFAVRLWAGA